MAMSTSPVHPHHATHPHRVATIAVWGVATLAVAVVGWLVFALAERGVDRLAGGLLLLAAAVAALATVVLVRGAGPRWAPAVASGGLLLAGAVATVAMLTAENVFAVDVLLAGGLPMLAGLVTWTMARSARRV